MTHQQTATRPPLRVGQAHRRALRPRRTGSTHAVVASALAVLALVGCVTAILLMATQPTATRLEQEVASLTQRLTATRDQVAALRTAVARSASQGASAAGAVGRLTGRLGALQRTVRGLQTSTTVAQQQAAGLHACVPELQQELAGLTLRTRSLNGWVRSVGLTNPVLISPACQAVF